MKILIITPFIPYPLDSGGNQAFFSMVDYLKDFHEISIILPVESWNRDNFRRLSEIWAGKVTLYPHDNSSFPKENDRYDSSLYLRFITYLHESTGRKIRRYMDRRIQRLAFLPEKFRFHSTLFNGLTRFPEGFMQFVHDIARKDKFDCIQVEFYSHFPFRMLFPENVKTVFVQHEIQFVRLANEMALFNKVTWNDRVLYERKKNEELAEMRAFDHIITLTETDKEILSGYIPTEKISVSPAVIRQMDDDTTFSSCGNEFAFVGGWSHLPNLDAVVWFCNNIIPVLRERKFSFRLYVVGSWKKKLVKEFTRRYPEIVFTGFIKDIEPFLKGKISLVPIRIGSGMRIKILEAINSMSPFITTTKGVEGQDFRDGEECLVADTAEAFAESMISLSSDVSLQERIAANAKKKIRESYDNTALLKRRAEIYGKI